MAVSRATAEKEKTIWMLQGALNTGRDIQNILADILYKAIFGNNDFQCQFVFCQFFDVKSVRERTCCMVTYVFTRKHQ